MPEPQEVLENTMAVAKPIVEVVLRKSLNFILLPLRIGIPYR